MSILSYALLHAVSLADWKRMNSSSSACATSVVVTQSLKTALHMHAYHSQLKTSYKMCKTE